MMHSWGGPFHLLSVSELSRGCCRCNFFHLQLPALEVARTLLVKFGEKTLENMFENLHLVSTECVLTCVRVCVFVCETVRIEDSLDITYFYLVLSSCSEDSLGTGSTSPIK